MAKKQSVVVDRDEELKKIQAELDEKGAVKVGDSKFLFLDVSSTCTGYTIASLDFPNKRASIEEAGVLWFSDKWDHQEKYSYIFNAIMTYFEVVKHVDFIVHEAYSINRDRMQGTLVLPEMIGAIKVAAAENSIKVRDIHPQSWRKQLGVRPIVENDKKDFKTPTKNAILKLVAVPEQSQSNITGQERTTPSDMYDSLGIAYGWLTSYGFSVTFKKTEFNTHIGMLTSKK